MISFGWAITCLTQVLRLDLIFFSPPFTHLAPFQSKLDQEINEAFDVEEEGAFHKVESCTLFS